MTVKWMNHNQNAYSNIWDYCVFYNCSTPGGPVNGEMVSFMIAYLCIYSYLLSNILQCKPEITRNYFQSEPTLEINGVPLNGNCSFRVMVLVKGHVYRWSNYETCIRNLSSPGSYLSIVI